MRSSKYAGFRPRGREQAIPMDPEWLVRGSIQRFLVHEDEYFADEPKDSEEGLRLDELVKMLLTEEEQTCVQLRVDALYSYGGIARYMGWMCGTPPKVNGKKAWRVTTAALKKLKDNYYTEEN